MKKNIVLCLVLSVYLFTGCGDTQKKEEKTDIVQQTRESFTVAGTSNGYLDSDYSVPNKISVKRDGVDYGLMDDQISYYSTTIGENKECGVLLPAGYNDEQKYPVVYILHGNGGDHYDWNRDDSFLQGLVGNMTEEKMMVPSIIVMADMWSAPKALKNNPTIGIQLDAYDEFYKDLKNDLIPYINEHYSTVGTREGTAIIGTSQGGTESLVSGFNLLDQMGYISALAPCTGVIPMPDYPASEWNTPVLEDFTIPNGLEPYYLALMVGDKDPWCIQSTKFYDQAMTENGILHDFTFVEGLGHEDALWEKGIYNFLKRIFR